MGALKSMLEAHIQANESLQSAEGQFSLPWRQVRR